MPFIDSKTGAVFPDMGRYHMDMHARLQHNPAAENPYRVQVGIWREEVPGDGAWHYGNPILFKWNDRNFKTLKKAAAYRAQVNLEADLGHFQRQVSDMINTGFVTL